MQNSEDHYIMYFIEKYIIRTYKHIQQIQTFIYL